MNQGFSTALSAMTAHSKALDVVGNNLANLNTAGFKASDISFEEAMSQQYGGGGQLQVGLGNNVPVSLRRMSQGGIQPSNSALDVAIRGNGFLIVKDAKGGEYLTRAGMLKLDNAGKLVNTTGSAVQGWKSGAIGDIVIPSGPLAPKATATVNASFNLNSGGGPLSFPVDVYDAGGAKKTLTVSLNPTTPGTPGAWTATYSLNGVALADQPEGSITFDADGVATTTSLEITLPPAVDGGTGQTITLNFAGADGAPTITESAAPSSMSAITQDGGASAEFLNARIGDNGNVYAVYAGGKEVLVAQLALASVTNPESLSVVGDNLLAVTSNTAMKRVRPGEAGTGTISGNALESSTADLAREFTNLISYQRGYQANSKLITTMDELMQETLSLKR